MNGYGPPGIDGEAALLDPPLRFNLGTGCLAGTYLAQAPLASPSAALPGGIPRRS